MDSPLTFSNRDRKVSPSATSTENGSVSMNTPIVLRNAGVERFAAGVPMVRTWLPLTRCR